MTTSKGLATRERIVAAAADLMHERGVAGTGMPLVRQRAAVSSSQIYHYFVDKDALVAAVVGHQVEAVVGGQRAALAALDTIESLRAWRDALVSAASTPEGQRGCPVGGLGAELADDREDARSTLAEAFDAWQSALREGLGRLGDAGLLADGVEADVTAAALLAVVQGGLLLAQVRRDGSALAAGLDTIIDAAVRDPQRP